VVRVIQGVIEMDGAFEYAWVLLKEEKRQLWGGDLDRFSAFRAVPKSAIPDILEHGVQPRSLEPWGDQIWHDSGIKIDPYQNKGSWWFTHTPRFRQFWDWYNKQGGTGNVDTKHIHPLLMATDFMSEIAPREGTGEFKRNLRGTYRDDYHTMRDLFGERPKKLWREQRRPVPMGIVGVKGKLPGKHWRDREGFPSLMGSPTSAVLTTKPVPADMIEEIEPVDMTELSSTYDPLNWFRERGKGHQFSTIDPNTGKTRWV